jgi:hypothetical protein
LTVGVDLAWPTTFISRKCKKPLWNVAFSASLSKISIMKKIFFIAFMVFCFSSVNAQHKNENNKPVPPPPPPVPVDLSVLPQPPLPPDAALVVVDVHAPPSPLSTEKDHLMVEPPAPPPLLKKVSKIRSEKQN